jgi:RNA polymerase sigma-70 factor (ECF subfamily)
VVTSARRHDTKETAAVTTEDVERATTRIPRTEGSEVCDEAGLRDAFLAHGGELLGFARRSLYASGSAEDAVQETFARAWRSRSRFDPTLGSLRTWLFTIERRVIIDIGVRQMKTRTVPIDQSEEPFAEDRLETAMLGWQMESALARLDPEHRMVITELYFNGRTGREVAELFALPEGTVRSRAFYALRMLRILLEEAGWDQ